TTWSKATMWWCLQTTVPHTTLISLLMASGSLDRPALTMRSRSTLQLMAALRGTMEFQLSDTSTLSHHLKISRAFSWIMRQPPETRVMSTLHGPDSTFTAAVIQNITRKSIFPVQATAAKHSHHRSESLPQGETALTATTPLREPSRPSDQTAKST